MAPVSVPPVPLETLAEPLRDWRRRFDELLAPHREALWHFCRRLTGSAWEAEDLVQETMLKAFGALPKLWQPVNPRAYLFRVATNAWVDQVRRERREALVDLDLHSGLPDPGSPEIRIELYDAMERLVTLLPPRQRVVVLLCDTLDFRASEVAAMLGTSEGAVKALLQRGRATLAVRRDEPAARLAGRGAPPMLHPLVERYVAAFNARDPDAIAQLLVDDAVTAIVGVADELGRETTRHASLAEWAADPHEQWVEPASFEGRAALLVYYRTPHAPRALAWLITLDTSDRGIEAQHQYYFTPELIRHVARHEGVPALTHGHWYVPASG